MSSRGRKVGGSSISKDLEERLRLSGSSSGHGASSSAGSQAAAAGTSLPPASSKALVNALRPGFGTIGRECKIRANHFLARARDQNISQYEFKINPEVKSRAMGRALMKKLIEEFGESHLKRCIPAYDGRNIFYTAGSLPFKSRDFELILPDKDGRDKTFKVSIRFTKSFDLYPLRQFVKGEQRECPYDIIAALDVVLRESPSHNYVTISRSFYSPDFGSTNFGEGLECLRGYFQSLRPTQMGLSLNVDVSATSFYKPVKILDFVTEYLNNELIPSSLTEKQRLGIQRVLKGVLVETTHMRNVRRRYKITGITSQSTSQLRFILDEGGATKYVAQYFREKYNYELIHNSLPCIKAGSDSKPKYLPMEICRIVEGQRYIKKLNDKQVTQMLKAACMEPGDREDKILQLVKKNNYNTDKYAKAFGIEVEPITTTIDARVLPTPKLKYNDSGRDKTCQPNVGQWNMINKRMFRGGTVDTWACISFSHHTRDTIEYFCQRLVSTCNNIGMVFNQNPVDIYICPPPSKIENSLRELHHQTVEILKRPNYKHKQLQLLFVVLPEARGSYGRIKRLCETELGLVTQCCQPKHLFKLNRQYLENLTLKINVKAGGCNTVLEDAFYKQIPTIHKGPTIIFGADVTHPAPGEDSPSIAAVVASMDWPFVTKYRGLVSAQLPRQEIIQDLFKTTKDPQKGNIAGGMIRELLIAFRRETKCKPNHIIFYRDGVSEGQFNDVLLLEMDAIRKACASLEEGYLPQVTFVVVQKRHHTRLFPKVHGDKNPNNDGSGNILPGTVVDKSICHPTEFDFFLCSHAGIQGTSRPTHYHVLLDENHFSADALQTLTYNLCYTFARCTRSVSIVPPAYYAHLAAFRAGYYLGSESEYGSSQVRGGSRQRTATNTSTTNSTLPQIKENVKDVMFYC